jgi:predicted N-acetyltransferase YhbS
MNKSLYTISTLAEYPEYFDDVMRLIEDEFHYSEPYSFATDFAQLVNPANFENCFIVIQQDTSTVVAHLGVLPRIMIKKSTEIPVIMIGGIVTSKPHRGKNLFRELMNHACELYKEKAALAFLWSELNDIYEKFYFYRAGGIIETGKSVITNDKTPEGFLKTKFNKLSNKEFDEIKNLYLNFNEKYFFTLKRNAQNWSLIHEMSSVDLFIKKNLNENCIESYFCYGKGKDLTCIIHEIGTSADNYNELINSLAPFKLWLPETEGKYFLKKEVLYSSFVKIVNRKILHDFLYELTQTDLAILSLTSSSTIQLSFRGDSFELTERDFIEGLFGPNPLIEFEPLSLSPYIAGTDSI